jgi:hypothetical protein
MKIMLTEEERILRRKKRQHLYYIEKRETILKRNKAWAIAHPKRMKELQKNWREVNSERVNEYARNWRKTNPEKAKTAVKKWNAANPEKFKELKKKGNALSYQRNRIKQRIRGILWEAVKSGKITRSPICCMCGKAGNVEAHHYNGYSKKAALDVLWVCNKCHNMLHVF